MGRLEALELRVGGIVQGVGFRPYVYALALECGVSGYVLNDARGVTVHLEGDRAALERFIKRFPKELPPLARLDSLEREAAVVQGLEGFEIRESSGAEAKSATVSPDMALCDNCRREMRDPSDRRYGYWLINCTDCGPRYSIMQTVPYDRPNISMASFKMCDACRSEYENPLDRRYHAQPVSCPECGPKLTYCEEDEYREDEAALQACAEALKSGQIVAVKGLGGFHLMCDATNEASVKLLRERKRRPNKPFAVMFPDMAALQKAVDLSSAEAELIASRERPIVLVRSAVSAVAPSVAPGIDRLGVFLPYTPLHERLFELVGVPLVATSANASDEPIIRSEEEIGTRLTGVADAVLSHDREIVNACDDTVVQMLDGRPLMLRLARGYAPATLTLPYPTERKILAVGGNQKSSIALAFEDKLILSPHIGDLGSLEAFGYFERTLQTFKRFYGFEPDLIVCDKHPGYETTKWARDQGCELLEVQHHHAHILACMAEYELEEEVLGFAFDGTGYGDDGTIWGGEAFLARGSAYERVFSLKPFRLLGGEKAVREPRRAALGLLFEHYPLKEVLQLDSPTVRAFGREEIVMLHRAWEKGINAPYTSSSGRLFDAVASLADICQEVSYEGESGLLLEASVLNRDAKSYAFSIDDGRADFAAMVEAIVNGEEDAGAVASRFLATLVQVMTEVAKGYDRRVVLSGGVFQNKTLLEMVRARFEGEGIAYLIPSKFPVNDGAIALGQAWYALCQLRGD